MEDLHCLLDGLVDSNTFLLYVQVFHKVDNARLCISLVPSSSSLVYQEVAVVEYDCSLFVIVVNHLLPDLTAENYCSLKTSTF